MTAEEVLRWGHAEFGERLCLTCSWQKQSSVLVHMVTELGLDLPVWVEGGLLSVGGVAV